MQSNLRNSSVLPRAFQTEPAQMGHIKDAGGAPHSLVLGENACILDRHFPTGEVHKSGSQMGVHVPERGLGDQGRSFPKEIALESRLDAQEAAT